MNLIIYDDVLAWFETILFLIFFLVAFSRCVEQGATYVVCHPYFLSRGRHVNEDIPALVASAAAENHGVRYSIAEPLGVQPGIIELIDSSVKKSLKLSP